MNGDTLAPLVSVVLPVHDTPPGFLQEAIESVRRQTESRWELVIVLDAATRACARVAHDMASLDPVRIRVVGEVGGSPLGASGARNLGIEASRAPVIAFLDADDMYEPERLRERLALLEAHPEVAMVYGPTLFWHSWAGRTDPGRSEHDYVPPLGVSPRVQHHPPALVTRFVSGSATLPCTCSILVRRSAIADVGGFNESFTDLYEDQVLYASLGLRFRMLADDRVLDRYRRHGASVTARASQSWAQRVRARFLDFVEQEMISARIEDAVLRRAIERERWKLRHPVLALLLRVPRKAASRFWSMVRPEARAAAPVVHVPDTRR